MIKKIKIQDYRSCLNTEFELHPNLSVLIGPNGSGKTNVLNGLLLLNKLIGEDEFRYRHPRYLKETLPSQCKLKVWFDINGKIIILTTDINIHINKDNREVIESINERWYLKDFTGKRSQRVIPLITLKELYERDFAYPHIRNSRRRMAFTDKRRMMFMYQNRERHYSNYSRKVIHEQMKDFPEEAWEAFESIVKYLSDIKYYSASQFTNPANCPVFFEIEKSGQQRRFTGEGQHIKFLFDLYNKHKTKSSEYTNFFNIIGPKGIGLIDRITFKEFSISSTDCSVRSGGGVSKEKRTKQIVIPKFTIGKQELSPNQLSEGTYRTISLIFYLITETGSLLLLEEPEVCVHHGLLSSIIELLKSFSHDKQIVISTHSDFVLDKVLPENVYKVSKIKNNGSKVTHIQKALSRRDIAALKKYLETEGNLGEYWKHGALEQ